MKLMSYYNLINVAFKYVINTSTQFNIDESHSLKHSMDVYHIANQIYQSELPHNPQLFTQKNVIDVSAILHDMCDKKYMDEGVSVNNIQHYMHPHMTRYELEMVSKIVSTMSYSTVKKNGFATIPDYQLSYHIVREADLLSAYDPDRCIIYGMMHENIDYIEATKRAIPLLETRVLKYIEDGLFVTDYSKERAQVLHEECEKKIAILKKII